MPSIPKKIKLSPVYISMLSFWIKYHSLSPEKEADICRKILWCNKRITSEGCPIYWKSWENKGILRMGDICHETKDLLLSHDEVSECYRMLHVGFSTKHPAPNWRDPTIFDNSSGIAIQFPCYTSQYWQNRITQILPSTDGGKQWATHYNSTMREMVGE